MRNKGALEVLPPVAIAENAATPDPGGTAARGTRVYSTTTSRLMEWHGSYWKSMPAVYVGTTAPTSPLIGDLWVDTN